MLFCFDVDGTLLTNKMDNEGQYVKGIIPTIILDRLQQQGHHVVIVSPSPFRPDGFKVFDRNGSNDYRWENIKDAMEYYGYSGWCYGSVVYIDDLHGNLDIVSKNLNIRTMTPIMFMDRIGNQLTLNY